MTSPLEPQSELRCPQCFRRSWHDTATLSSHPPHCTHCLLPLTTTGRFTHPAYLASMSEREASYQLHAPTPDYGLSGLDASTRHAILDGGLSAL